MINTMNKLFKSKYGSYPEAIIFSLIIILAALLVLSFYIPIAVPDNFNAFNKEHLKNFSIHIFGSYNYLLYIATWLSTWIFLFTLVFNMIVSLSFIDLCFEEIVSPINPLKKKIIYVIFSSLLVLADFFVTLYLYRTFLNF